MMGLNVWFLEDIRNALLAANEASAATVAVIAEAEGPSCQHQFTLTLHHRFQCVVCQQELSLQEVYDYLRNYDSMLAATVRAFRDGFKVALVTVALAFGLAPQAIIANKVIAETGGTARRPGEVETHDRVHTDIPR